MFIILNFMIVFAAELVSFYIFEEVFKNLVIKLANVVGSKSRTLLPNIEKMVSAQ